MYLVRSCGLECVSDSVHRPIGILDTRFSKSQPVWLHRLLYMLTCMHDHMSRRGYP